MDKKHASIGKYVLLKTLGSGYNSKVKLGLDTEKNKYFAIKIIKHSHPKLNLKIISKEVDVLLNLSHANIVNLIEYKDSAEYVKKNGQKYKSVMIVMELVPNGEIFDYVAITGRFSERVARTYFRMLIETLEYCHNSGYTHRDLKPENLLLDENFNLKVADFGFATLVSGKDGTGQLHTWLGTESYMAPELVLKQSYSGPAVDLFASAIILFILMAGTPPFKRADPQADPHYKLIAINRSEVFWAAHERGKTTDGSQFFSDNFRSFINSMLALDPAVRLTMSEIKNHEWYKGDAASMDEILFEFSQRKMMRDEKIAKEKQAKEMKKLQAQQNMKNTNVLSYRGVQATYRSLEDDLREIETKLVDTKNVDLELKRECLEYVECVNNEREMKTILPPDVAFKYLLAACGSQLNEYEVSKNSYKVKGKAIKDLGTVSMKIKITQVDGDVCCVEFMKTQGSPVIFYQVIAEIKKFFPIFEGEKKEVVEEKVVKEATN